MKSKVLIWVGLASASIFFMSAGSILVSETRKEMFPEKEITIAIREVGHQVLLHSGDARSRVLPVKCMKDNTYQLEFQSEFTFVPDSLVNILKKSLAGIQMPLPYIVNVLDCKSHDIVYGFQIGFLKKTTLVPCLGRAQPMGCYTIQISFLTSQAPVDQTKRSYLLVIALASLIMIGFVGSSYWRRGKQGNIPNGAGFIQVGQYEFFADRKILRFQGKITEMSDKETALLKIFAESINQPVQRQRLMKEVWEDEGALISRSLDVFVSRLRKKLKDDPGLQLVNIHGVGYKLGKV